MVEREKKMSLGQKVFIDRHESRCIHDDRKVFELVSH